MSPEQLEVLRDLHQFAQAYPPALPFQARQPRVDSMGSPRPGLIYLHPGIRVRVAVEQTSDIGHGLWRTEVLGEAGTSCAELDAEQFASGLVKELADDLSIRDLECLVAAFQSELDTMLSNREAAIRRHQLHSQNPSTPPETP